MKKKLLFFFLAGGLLWACDTIEGSGIHADEERNVQAFYEGVKVEDGIQVLFSPNLRPGCIHISGDSEILSYVEAYVSSGETLILRYEPWVKIKTHIPTIITLPETVGLRAITASGGALVQAFYEIDAPFLSLKASGGAKMELFCYTGALDIDGSGGSRIQMAGWADKASISLSGGSRLQAYNLSVADLQAQLSGGSQTEISCVYQIRVTASGGSYLYYRGSAQVVESNLTGGSRIERR